MERRWIRKIEQWLEYLDRPRGRGQPRLPIFSKMGIFPLDSRLAWDYTLNGRIARMRDKHGESYDEMSLRRYKLEVIRAICQTITAVSLSIIAAIAGCQITK